MCSSSISSFSISSAGPSRDLSTPLASNSIDCCLDVLKSLNSEFSLINYNEFRESYQKIKSREVSPTVYLLDLKDYRETLMAFLKPTLLACSKRIARLVVDFMLNIMTDENPQKSSTGIIFRLLKDSRNNSGLSHIVEATKDDLTYEVERYDSYSYFTCDDFLEGFLGELFSRPYFRSSSMNENSEGTFSKEIFIEFLNTGYLRPLQKVLFNWEVKGRKFQTPYYLAFDSSRGQAKVLSIHHGELNIERNEEGKWQLAPQPPTTSSSMECLHRFLSFAYEANRDALFSSLLSHLNQNVSSTVMDYVH